MLPTEREIRSYSPSQYFCFRVFRVRQKVKSKKATQALGASDRFEDDYRNCGQCSYISWIGLNDHLQNAGRTNLVS